MKSIEDQIKFVDKILLPFFGIKSIIDYESTFEITSEIDLNAFNLIISDFREIFPAKEFSLHKTKYKIETSNQALCILKKCMDLIQLPYVVETITRNKMSFKQVRLNQTNTNLYKYIQVKMSEIRSQFSTAELLPKETEWWDVDSSENTDSSKLINIYRPMSVNTVQCKYGSKSYDIRTAPPNPKFAVSPWNNSSIEPDSIIQSSLIEPTGVNTISTSLKNPSYDIRGTPPNPKYVVSPWQTSSYEPDIKYDLKPPKDLPITLQHDDLTNAVVESKLYTTNLSSSRIIDNDGCCTIDLKNYYFYDKCVNSVKCKFKSKKINNESIMSKYYIDTIVQGSQYQILIGGGELISGTFYNDKELLPECEKNSIMILLQKLLSYHSVVLKIKFDKSHVGGLKFVDIELTTSCVKFNSETDESLVETVLYNNYDPILCGKKKYNVGGIEQLIKNEKQLYNKARLMSGMGGNAFTEFLEKDNMIQTENEISKFTQNKPKISYKIGNLTGYDNYFLEIPVDDYHFCSHLISKKYTQIDPTVNYSYQQNTDSSFTHCYALSFNNIFMSRDINFSNPRDIYAISQMSVSLENLTNDKIKLYVLITDKMNKIEIVKLNIGYTIENCTLVVDPNYYLCLTNLHELKGFLIEVQSNNSDEPFPDIITLEYTEYTFCPDVRRQLAQHNVVWFDLKNIVVKK